LIDRLSAKYIGSWKYYVYAAPHRWYYTQSEGLHMDMGNFERNRFADKFIDLRCKFL